MLELYRFLNSYNVSHTPFKETKEETPLGIDLENMSKNITREQAELSKKVFIAQNLNEYRRKQSSVFLIPKVEIEFDKLLFDVEELVNCTPIL